MNKEELIEALRHIPKQKHPRMSIYQRSAQFAPFAALEGFEDDIYETGRITTSKIVLEEDELESINNTLNIKRNNLIKITYFVKDKNKIGGKYLEKTDYIKKIDLINKYIILRDGTKILFTDILKIE